MEKSSLKPLLKEKQLLIVLHLNTSVEKGLYSLKSNKITSDNYGGYVVASKGDNNSFNYTLYFRNKDFYVNGFSSGAVAAKDVLELDGTGKAIKTECP